MLDLEKKANFTNLYLKHTDTGFIEKDTSTLAIVMTLGMDGENNKYNFTFMYFDDI